MYGPPLIVAGIFFGARLFKSHKNEMKAVEAKAVAMIEPLKAQMARHQSIIDSYDFGRHS